MYLNRRGFAPIVMCHECGWQSPVPQLRCAPDPAPFACRPCYVIIAATPSRFPKPVPGLRPRRSSRHYGIGTEQLQQGLAAVPAAAGAARRPRRHRIARGAQIALQQLQSGEPCILIGTQMIAKGHDYPGDHPRRGARCRPGLFSASYRASERLAQTLLQVCGRSGRGDRSRRGHRANPFPGASVDAVAGAAQLPRYCRRTACRNAARSGFHPMPASLFFVPTRWSCRRPWRSWKRSGSCCSKHGITSGSPVSGRCRR